MDSSAKLWPWFVVMTILCWGAYVPVLHTGQTAFEGKGPLRAFLFVGVAYFLASLAVLIYLMMTRVEPFAFTGRGVSYSTVAGVLGAIGALGIVFALRYGGKPIYVAPLVFAGAPIINTVVSMIWHRPHERMHPMFLIGIVIAAFGASMVLRFKPS
jgi:hypothetical protein